MKTATSTFSSLPGRSGKSRGASAGCEAAHEASAGKVSVSYALDRHATSESGPVRHEAIEQYGKTTIMVWDERFS